MKKFTILLFSICTFSLFAQTTYVPDDNFEQALIDWGYDDVLDDTVVTANISGITNFSVNGKNISDLTGIEDFISLVYFYCASNQITSLDVSNSPNLEVLWCQINQLSNLNLSQNHSLQELNCNYNNLTNLDLSQCVALTNLNCEYNQLNSLDVSNSPQLVHFRCSHNQITDLDISQNGNLFRFMCSNNKLSSLDMRNGNNTNLPGSNFIAFGNRCLTCIYVDNANWSESNWSNIDNCSSFVETETTCETLYTYIPDDNFEQVLIDMQYDCALDDYVGTACISTISSLYIDNKNIQDLTGIEDFTSLTVLYCSSNQLSILDLSQNTNLEVLYCSNNRLTSLDLSQNLTLNSLKCNINSLTFLDVRNGINTTFSEFFANNNPALTCIFVDDATWSAANWIHIDPTSTFVETQAECDALIGIDDAIFSQGITIFPNPTTGIINIEIVDVDAIDNMYLSDILGQRIIDNQKSMQIDISDFSSGIYFLNLESKTGDKVIYKVIKE